MKREIREFVDNMEKRSSEEREGVELDEIACCALNRAFEKNPEVTEELRDNINEQETFDNFRQIFKRAGEVKFTPADNMKTVCGQIAKRELERIEAEDEDDKDLSCGHSVDDHEVALKFVVEKMRSTIN